MQGRPGDSGNLVLLYAVASSRAVGFQYHEDRVPDKRSPSINILRQVLARSLGWRWSALHTLMTTSRATREDLRADTSDERALALILVVDGGRPRLGSVYSVPRPQGAARNVSAAQTQSEIIEAGGYAHLR